jgi:BCD family chlorophyll transporter-like MFS transporter
VVWIMMIAGIAVTATIAGRLLDPFSPLRLLTVATAVGGAAMLVTVLAVWRMEGAPGPVAVRIEMPFRQALAQIWADDQARRFTQFVFVSMFAYSAQELILEPCLGVVFHLTPGESTALTGLQHGGVLTGMALVAVVGGRLGGMRLWTVGGCLCSALAILGLAASAWTAASWAVHPAIFTLGVTNGVFAVSAIGAMMGLAHAGNGSGAGTRMGLWGAAQALAFGLGGLTGTSATDLARYLFGAPDIAYAAVLIGEAVLFVIAAVQALRAFQPGATRARRLSPLTLGSAPWPRGG